MNITEQTSLRDLMHFIVSALVDDPSQVRITEHQGEATTVLQIAVAKTDLGKVIGKSGRTANALRTILLAASTTQKRRAIIEILEDHE